MSTQVLTEVTNCLTRALESALTLDRAAMSFVAMGFALEPEEVAINTSAIIGNLVAALAGLRGSGGDTSAADAMLLLSGLSDPP